MNIALGALIILLLLLPALLFRLGITAVRFSFKKATQADAFSLDLARKNFINVLSKLNFSETLFFFSVIPLILHLISIYLIVLSGREIDFKLLLDIFSSQKDIIKNNLSFTHELSSFLFYILIETIIGFVAGMLLTLLLIRIPDFNNALVGENLYWRLFTGALLDPDKRKLVDVIVVDIVSETKETTIIYSGFLEKFDIIPDKNELAYITLSGARRRDLRRSSQVSEVGNIKFTTFDNNNGDMIVIPGKYFTIPGDKVSNVNITYIDIQTITDQSGRQTQILVPVD